MELIGIIFMLVLSAFFSGSEIAFVVANRLRVEVAARRGGLIGPIVRDFLQEPAKFLTTTLVGNNVAMVVYSTLMAFYLDAPIAYFWTEVVGLDSGEGGAVLITQTVIASMIVLFVGEILPKSIMREIANHAVFYLALPLRITYYLLLPLIKLAGWTSSLLIKLFRADADTFSQFLRRDFEVIIQESRESGELDLDEEETTLLSNVFAMSGIRVKESMVPRTDIKAVEENMPIEDLRERFIETGLSKLAVFRENIDHIVGVVFAFDLFTGPATLQDIVRPVQYVPESKRSKELLSEFLAANSSIAIVIDEYGGTAGLVTREDLLEELFGDIQDEFDIDQDVLRQTSEDTYIVSGRVDVDELTERFAIDLPEGDYETVAGYLIEKLGTIPMAKEEFVLDGYRFIIIKATPNRVDLVRIIREPALG